MAILNLSPPFKGVWKRGYLRTSKDGRKRVDLVNTNKDRTTISYARYLMCVELGYVLSEGYEVDHKNRDKTDDSLSNLEVLTVDEHREKTRIEASTGRTNITVTCKNCGITFNREKRLVGRGELNTFCSYKCNQAYNMSEGKLVIGVPKSKEIIDEIKRLREIGKSGYRIAKDLGISRNTVMKYW